MKAPRLTDTTLRDGSHAMKHQFTREQVRNVAQSLDKAGIQVIEVTHGDGLAGSSIQYGFSLTDEMDLIEEARKAVMDLRLDPHAASLMAGELVSDHASYLKGRVGRQPTAGELYAAHFLGPKGSAQLIEAM